VRRVRRLIAGRRFEDSEDLCRECRLRAKGVR
jgi:hypothetical protein